MTALPAQARSPDRLHLQHAGACRTAFRDAPDTCARILLVGEDNPISAAPEHALFCAPAGCAGQRLQELIFGLPRLQYLALWRTNLCVGGWSARRARARAGELVASGSPWNIIVMLGRKVAEAFARTDPEVLLGEVAPFSAVAVGDVRFASLPHPSGRNTVWNQRGPIENARRIMAELAPELAWGAA